VAQEAMVAPELVFGCVGAAELQAIRNEMRRSLQGPSRRSVGILWGRAWGGVVPIVDVSGVIVTMGGSWLRAILCLYAHGSLERVLGQGVSLRLGQMFRLDMKANVTFLVKKRRCLLVPSKRREWRENQKPQGAEFAVYKKASRKLAPGPVKMVTRTGG